MTVTRDAGRRGMPDDVRVSQTRTMHLWTALQLAVENQWGGRSSNQKAAQLESDVLGWFVHLKGAASILCINVVVTSFF